MSEYTMPEALSRFIFQCATPEGEAAILAIYGEGRDDAEALTWVNRTRTEGQS